MNTHCQMPRIVSLISLIKNTSQMPINFLSPYEILRLPAYSQIVYKNKCIKILRSNIQTSCYKNQNPSSYSYFDLPQ